MTPERLQEIKEHHLAAVNFNCQPDTKTIHHINELIAFAETALPLMTGATIVDSDEARDKMLKSGRFTAGRFFKANATPSRGDIAMHLYAGLLACEYGPKDAPTVAEKAVLHADALILELERKK